MRDAAMAAVGRGAAFQQAVFSESRCTNHIHRSFILTDSNRCEPARHSHALSVSPVVLADLKLRAESETNGIVRCTDDFQSQVPDSQTIQLTGTHLKRPAINAKFLRKTAVSVS
jgi:hypothetical protein